MNDKCDLDVFKNGETVAIVADRDSNGIEVLVRELVLQIGVKMDWFYMGGRGVVRAIGDAQIAREAFRRYTNSWLVVVEQNGTWTRGKTE